MNTAISLHSSSSLDEQISMRLLHKPREDPPHDPTAAEPSDMEEVLKDYFSL